jgi:hypothetical protein
MNSLTPPLIRFIKWPPNTTLSTSPPSPHLVEMISIQKHPQEKPLSAKKNPSFDSYTHFTPAQEKRMYSMWDQFRAGK